MPPFVPKHAVSDTQPSVFYHVAPRAARQSILQHGLRGADYTHEGPWANADWHWREEQPHGNYMFGNIEDAQDYVTNLAQRGWERTGQEPEPENYNLSWGDGGLTTPNGERYDPDNEEHAAEAGHPGFDIWRVFHNPDEHSLRQDPENALSDEHGNWGSGTGELSQAEALHEIRQFNEENGEGPDDATAWDYVGDREPMRWYTPEPIHPRHLNVEEHHEPWNIDEDRNYYNEVPMPLTRVPFNRYFGSVSSIDTSNTKGIWNGERLVTWQVDPETRGPHHAEYRRVHPEVEPALAYVGLNDDNTFWHEPTHDAMAAHTGIPLRGPTPDSERREIWRSAYPEVSASQEKEIEQATGLKSYRNQWRFGAEGWPQVPIEIHRKYNPKFETNLARLPKWEPGKMGKGMVVLDTGEPVTWADEEIDPQDFPEMPGIASINELHHEDVARFLGGMFGDKVYIYPDGNVLSMTGGDLTPFFKADPRLHTGGDDHWHFGANPGEETPPDPVDPSSWGNKALKLKNGEWVTWDSGDAHMVYAHKRGIPFDDIAEMWGWSPNAGWFNYTKGYYDAYKDIHDDLTKGTIQWSFGTPSKFASNVVELGDSGRGTHEGGEPVVYHSPSRTLFIGSPGEYHDDMRHRIPGHTPDRDEEGFQDPAEEYQAGRFDTPERKMISWYFDGPHQDEVHQDFGIPGHTNGSWKFEQFNFSKVADWHKGLLFHDGSEQWWPIKPLFPHGYNEDEHGEDDVEGTPSHTQYMDNHNIDHSQVEAYLQRGPSGNVSHYRLDDPQWRFGETASPEPGEDWQKGHPGKAVVFPSNDVWAWVVDHEGSPHHWDLAGPDKLRVKPRSYFNIDPDGTVSGKQFTRPERLQPQDDAALVARYIGGQVNQGWNFSKVAGTDWTVEESDFDPANSYLSEAAGWYTHSPWVGDPKTKTIYIGQAGSHHHDLTTHHGLPSLNHDDAVWGVVNNGMISVGNPSPGGKGEDPRVIADALHKHLGPGFADDIDHSLWDFESKTAAVKVEGYNPLEWQGHGDWRYSVVGDTIHLHSGDTALGHHHFEYLQDQGVLDDSWGWGIGAEKPATDYHGMRDRGVTDLGWIYDTGVVASSLNKEPDPRVVALNPQWRAEHGGWKFAADTWAFDEPQSPWFKYVVFDDGTAEVSPEDDAMHSELSGGLPTLDYGYVDPNNIEGTVDPQHQQAVRRALEEHRGAARKNTKQADQQHQQRGISGQPTRRILPSWATQWARGFEGKYIVYDDGSKLEWRVDRDMTPHHTDVEDNEAAWDHVSDYGTIDEDGYRTSDQDEAWNFQANAKYTPRAPIIETVDGRIVVGEPHQFHEDLWANNLITHNDLVHGRRGQVDDEGNPNWYDQRYWNFRSAVAYEKGLKLKDGSELWWPITPSFPMEDDQQPQENRHEFEGSPTHAQYMSDNDIDPQTVADLTRGPSGKVNRYNYDQGWVGQMFAAKRPTVLYHSTPKAHRESIQEHGLLTRNPITNDSKAERDGTPEGVYLFEHPEDAINPGPIAHDTWAVDTSGLPIQPDTAMELPAWFSSQPVPAERLRLMSPIRVTSSGEQLDIPLPQTLEGPQKADSLPREESASTTLLHFLTQPPTSTVADIRPVTQSRVATDSPETPGEPRSATPQSYPVGTPVLRLKDGRELYGKQWEYHSDLAARLSLGLHDLQTAERGLVDQSGQVFYPADKNQGTGQWRFATPLDTADAGSRPSFKEFLAFGNGGEGIPESENEISAGSNERFANALAKGAGSWDILGETPEGPWQRGQYGKALLKPDGEVISWNVDGRGDAYPSHDMMGWNPSDWAFVIDPQGNVRHQTPPMQTSITAEQATETVADAIGGTPDYSATWYFSKTAKRPEFHVLTPEDMGAASPISEWSFLNKDTEYQKRHTLIYDQKAHKLIVGPPDYAHGDALNAYSDKTGDTLPGPLNFGWIGYNPEWDAGSDTQPEESDYGWYTHPPNKDELHEFLRTQGLKRDAMEDTWHFGAWPGFHGRKGLVFPDGDIEDWLVDAHGHPHHTDHPRFEEAIGQFWTDQGQPTELYSSDVYDDDGNPNDDAMESNWQKSKQILEREGYKLDSGDSWKFGAADWQVILGTHEDLSLHDTRQPVIVDDANKRIYVALPGTTHQVLHDEFKQEIGGHYNFRRYGYAAITHRGLHHYSGPIGDIGEIAKVLNVEPEERDTWHFGADKTWKGDWEPGWPGKGLVDHEGNAWAWKTDQTYDGWPSHMDYIDQIGMNQRSPRAYYSVEANGQFTNLMDGNYHTGEKLPNVDEFMRKALPQGPRCADCGHPVEPDADGIYTCPNCWFHGDAEDEQQTEGWNFSKTADAGQLFSTDWTPGHYGKAIVFEDGRVKVWNTAGGYDGSPTHEDMCEGEAYLTWRALVIDPQGNVRALSNYESINPYSNEEAAEMVAKTIGGTPDHSITWYFAKTAATLEDLRDMWGEAIKPEDEDEVGRYPIMQYPNGHTLLGPEGAQHYDILNLNEDWDDRSDRRHGFLQTNPDGSQAVLDWYDPPHDHEGAMQELRKHFPDIDSGGYQNDWNFSKVANQPRVIPLYGEESVLPPPKPADLNGMLPFLYGDRHIVLGKPGQRHSEIWDDLGTNSLLARKVDWQGWADTHTNTLDGTQKIPPHIRAALEEHFDHKFAQPTGSEWWFSKVKLAMDWDVRIAQPSEEIGQADPEYGWRRPIIVDPHMRTIYVGNKGDYHSDLHGLHGYFGEDDTPGHFQDELRGALPEDGIEGFISGPNELSPGYEPGPELIQLNWEGDYLPEVAAALKPYFPNAEPDLAGESGSWNFSLGHVSAVLQSPQVAIKKEQGPFVPPIWRKGKWGKAYVTPAGQPYAWVDQSMARSPDWDLDTHHGDVMHATGNRSMNDWGGAFHIDSEGHVTPALLGDKERMKILVDSHPDLWATEDELKQYEAEQKKYHFGGPFDWHNLPDEPVAGEFDLPWQPGNRGKGIILRDGSVRTWHFEQMPSSFFGHHLRHPEYGQRRNFMEIAPDGTYNLTFHDPEGYDHTQADVEAVARHDPRLKFDQAWRFGHITSAVNPEDLYQKTWRGPLDSTDPEDRYQPWEHGHYGKGLILNDGTVLHWRTPPDPHAEAGDSYPAHNDAIDDLGIRHAPEEHGHTPFWVTPDGEAHVANWGAHAQNYDLVEDELGVRGENGWKFGARLPWDMPSDEVAQKVHEYWSTPCPNCGAEWKDTERAGFLGSMRYCRKCHHEWSMNPDTILQDDPPLPPRSEKPEIFEGESGAYNQYDADKEPRRPAIYIPKLNHIYVGPPGAYHGDIHKDFKHLDNHELEDDRLEGYIGPKLGEFWDTTMLKDEAPPEVLEAMKQRYGVPFRNESERPQEWHFGMEFKYTCPECGHHFSDDRCPSCGWTTQWEKVAAVRAQWAGDPYLADPGNGGEYPILYDDKTGELLVGHEGLHHGDVRPNNSGYFHGVAATRYNPTGGGFQPGTVGWLDSTRPVNEGEIIAAISDLIGVPLRPETDEEKGQWAFGSLRAKDASVPNLARKLASMTPWVPGHFGKGLWHPKNGLVLWSGNEPHHMPTANRLGYPFDDHLEMLRVHPDGRVGGWIGPLRDEAEQGILAADSRLKPYERKFGDLGEFDLLGDEEGLSGSIGEPRDASVGAQETAGRVAQGLGDRVAELDRNTPVSVDIYESHELGNRRPASDDPWITKDLTGRRPMMYEPRFKAVHIGPYDHSHSDLVAGIWQRYGDRYEKSYPAGQYGWVGYNPEVVGTDDISEGGDTYGWYTAPENHEEIREALKQHGLSYDQDADKWHFGAAKKLRLAPYNLGSPGKVVVWRDHPPTVWDAWQSTFDDPVAGNYGGYLHHTDVIEAHPDRQWEAMGHVNTNGHLMGIPDKYEDQVYEALGIEHPTKTLVDKLNDQWKFGAFGDVERELSELPDWEPGTYGKGMVHREVTNPLDRDADEEYGPWKLKVWPVDRDGNPHHIDVLADGHETGPEIFVDPEGRTDTAWGRDWPGWKELSSLIDAHPHLQQARAEGEYRPYDPHQWHFGADNLVNGGHNVVRSDGSNFVTAPWEPGRPGKGIYADGKLHLWAQEGGLEPHHDDIFAHARGIDSYSENSDWDDYYAAPKIYIDPSGEVTSARMGKPKDMLGIPDPPEIDFSQFDPRLHNPTVNAWSFT